MNKEGLLNIALVGCGGMAASYRHIYTKILGAKLAMLVDSNEDTVKEAAREIGVERWSTDFEAVLAPDIDVVDISTPNFLHAPQSIAAMKAGKHVLVQKPIAPSLEEAEEMMEVAGKTGVKAGMYMCMQENPLYHDIKKLIESGLLGRISAVHCRGGGKGGITTPPDTWRQSAEKTGGGAFIQKTIHFTNLAQWLINSKIISVSAFSRNLMCDSIGGDDVTAAACEFESGILGTLEASYCADPHMLAIYGTKGYVSIINNTKLDIRLEDKYEGETIQYRSPDELLTFYYHVNTNMNPYDQHIAFVKAVQNNTEVPVSLGTGLYDLKVVKAVYTSAQEKRAVSVE